MNVRNSFRQRASAVVVACALVVAGCGGGIKTSAPLKPGENSFAQPTGYGSYADAWQQVRSALAAPLATGRERPTLPSNNDQLAANFLD